MCDNRHESDIQMVLSTLGLANPISERLLNKYLLDGPIGRAGSRIGKWNDLLINMWSSFIDSSKELSLEENEAILCFVRRCFSFIHKCIRYNIIQVNTQRSEAIACAPQGRCNSMVTLSIPDTINTAKSTRGTEGEMGDDTEREASVSEVTSISNVLSLVAQIAPTHE